MKIERLGVAEAYKMVDGGATLQISSCKNLA